MHHDASSWLDNFRCKKSLDILLNLLGFFPLLYSVLNGSLFHLMGSRNRNWDEVRREEKKKKKQAGGSTKAPNGGERWRTKREKMEREAIVWPNVISSVCFPGDKPLACNRGHFKHRAWPIVSPRGDASLCSDPSAFYCNNDLKTGSGTSTFQMCILSRLASQVCCD